jgi:hypothetical protein
VCDASCNKRHLGDRCSLADGVTRLSQLFYRTKLIKYLHESCGLEASFLEVLLAKAGKVSLADRLRMQNYMPFELSK